MESVNTTQFIGYIKDELIYFKKITSHTTDFMKKM